MRISGGGFSVTAGSQAGVEIRLAAMACFAAERTVRARKS